MKMPLLTINTLELEAYGKILFGAKEYYLKMYTKAKVNPKYLTSISEAYLKHHALDMMHSNVLNRLTKTAYTYDYCINVSDCLYLLSCVLPTSNLTYYARVKTIVLEHCVKVLKHYDLIDRNATFKPALPELEITDYFNVSTNIQDFFEN